MENSQAILKQLVWIKWFLILIALSVVAVMSAIGFAATAALDEIQKENAANQFAERAYDLLQQGKEIDVIELAKSREVTHPKDPMLHWYRARALYQLKDYSGALASTLLVEVFAPEWKAQYTEPFRDAIEEMSEELR